MAALNNFLQSLPIFLILISEIFGGQGASRPTLSTPRLLLPHRGLQAVQYTLHVSEGRDAKPTQGCFIWQSSRPEIVSVRSVDEEGRSVQCSTSAIVTVESRSPPRKTAIVTAEDPIGGVQLRTDIIVDGITEFSIETTTRELYLDDSPEEFVIRAKNEMGDVFSCLEGLIFDCSISTDKSAANQVLASEVLRILKFSQSTYDAPLYIRRLEDQGRHGDRILLQGTHTGTAIVTVKPTDPLYKNLEIASVQIAVVANLQLSPASTYILQHATVQYRVDILKQGRAYLIDMPSDQYRLELASTDVASLDTHNSVVTGLTLGSTELFLKGQRTGSVELSEAFREPSAVVYVVAPSLIGFTVVDARDFVLLSGNTYVVYVDVFDKENHKIHPSPNLKANAVFASHYFQVLSSSDNGTYHVVRTLHSGNTEISGELLSVTSKGRDQLTFKPAITGRQTIDILEPISIQPHTLVLPVQAVRNVQYQLKATGGSGNYNWSSSDETMTTVGTYGLLTTTALATGSCKITVEDRTYPAIKDISIVHIVAPTRMELLASRVEAETGSELRLSLAVYGRTNGGSEMLLTACHMLNIAVHLTDKSTFINPRIEASEMADACADVVLTAQVAGHTQVSIQYVSGSRGKLSTQSATTSVTLSTAVTVAAYLPLKAVQPAAGLTVISRGTSREIRFEGGPRPWILDQSGYIQQVKFDEGKTVSRTDVEHNAANRDSHVFYVTCLEEAEQLIELTVGNTATEKNLFPAVVNASIVLSCEQPKALLIAPLLPPSILDGLPPCPIPADLNNPVHIPVTLDNVRFVATVTDRYGRVFDNFTSLVVDWSVSDSELGAVLSAPNNKNSLLGSREQLIELRGHTGTLVVTASINKFDKKYTRSWISAEISPVITDSRRLHITSYPTFSPSPLTIYNHALDQTRLEIKDGSGYFHMSNDSIDKPVIELETDEGNQNSMLVRAVSEGNVTLTLIDLCLTPVKHIYTTISVSDLAQITLSVLDKIAQGEEVECYVQVLDRQGSPLHRDHFQLMQLQPLYKPGFITVRLSPNRTASVRGVELDNNTEVYLVRGVALGKTELRLAAQSIHKKQVFSRAIDIQVFSPLILDPPTITLVPGSVLQIHAVGGPDGAHIQYLTSSSAVASVSAQGLVFAHEVGSVTVIGQALDITGRVYCSDRVEVKVVNLTGVLIRAPITSLLVGTKMPLYATGTTDELNPFSFAGLAPALSFHWSINHPMVATLETVYHRCGVVTHHTANVAMRLYARTAGRVDVTLKVVRQGAGYHYGWSHSMTVEVIERLELVAPAQPPSLLLITPNTHTNIITNRDSEASISYSVLSDTTSTGLYNRGHHRSASFSDVATSNDSPVVRVSTRGQVSSGSTPGQAMLEITSTELFGVNQTSLLLVKVKPLSYMMLTPVTSYKQHKPHTNVADPLSTLPLYSSMDYIVSYHDDTGLEFYATTHIVALRPHTLDVQLNHLSTNRSFTVTLDTPGIVTLKAWDTLNPRIADYIALPIASVIYPENSSVVLGSVVCFYTPLYAEEGGWWTDEGPLAVAPHTGILHASVEGPVTISFNLSAHLSTHTSIAVLPVRALQLVIDPPVQFISNSFNSTHSLAVTVLLYNTAASEAQVAGLIGKNCSKTVEGADYRVGWFPYVCNVKAVSKNGVFINVDSVLTIMPVLNIKRGVYQCLVAINTSEEHYHALSQADSELEISVAVQQSSAQPLIAQSISLPLTPLFHVLHTRIFLNAHKPSTHIKVLWIKRLQPNLQVVSEAEHVLHVEATPATPGPSDSEMLMKFLVTLQKTNNPPTTVQVLVSSQQLDYTQIVLVDINHDLLPEKDDPNAVGWVETFYWYLLAGLILAVLLLFGWSLVLLYMLRQSTLPSPDSFFVSPTKSNVQSNGGAITPQLWSVDRGPYTPTSPLNLSGEGVRHRAVAR